jgi:NTP pyrophosphatase (non-canonical NTP hydrolase)
VSGFADAFRALQQRVGEGNDKRGFHAESDRLKADVSKAGSWIEFSTLNAIRNYQITKLALVIGEASEAIEELRAGREVTEAYYPTNSDPTLSHESVIRSDRTGADLVAHKPEGVPSELADIVIRCMDFGHEWGIDLAAAIEEKLDYNETRPFMHGGKRV